uniref:Uncharacterized protein n=1 Tax=Oryza sativa subsp. japonica TaxID=39947 RepID=Q67VL1_ORYSJ|nr:hypothetical protein [Oryza sativa Japonica Group]
MDLGRRPLIFAFYTDMKMISVVRIAEKESLTEGGDLIFLVEKNRNVLMGSWLSCKSPNSKGPVIICWSPVLVVLGDSPPVTLDHSLMLLLLPFISGNPIQVVSSSLSQVTTLNHQPLFDQFAGYLSFIEISGRPNNNPN